MCYKSVRRATRRRVFRRRSNGARHDFLLRALVDARPHVKILTLHETPNEEIPPVSLSFASSIRTTRLRSAKRLFARSRPSLRVLRTHRAVRLPRFVTLNPLRARLVRRDKLFTLGHTLFLNLGLVIHRFVVLDVAPARAIDRSIVPSSRRQSPLSRASRRGRPVLPPDAFYPERPSLSRLSRRVSASPHAHLRRPSVRQTVKSHWTL